MKKKIVEKLKKVSLLQWMGLVILGGVVLTVIHQIWFRR